MAALQCTIAGRAGAGQVFFSECLRGMIGILSAIPGACGCTPEDVQWLFPLEVEMTPQRKGRKAVAHDGLSECDGEAPQKQGETTFGDLSETCRQMVRHMQRTKEQNAAFTCTRIRATLSAVGCAGIYRNMRQAQECRQCRACTHGQSVAASVGNC